MTRTSIARTAQQQRNAPILRYALFGDIQPRHHLDTRDQQRGQFTPGRSISRNVPSTRKRITRLFQTSRCGYPAPSFDCLCQHGVDRGLMIGASSSLSSRSSVSGSSSARVKVLGGTEIFHQLASLEESCRQTAFSRCSNPARRFAAA
ncbi:hypothetical protein O5282_17885 [Escherichia coli]|nr:hypothetical protein [Escherichia coli]